MAKQPKLKQPKLAKLGFNYNTIATVYDRLANTRHSQ